MKDVILKSLKKVTGEQDVQLDIPENSEFGDYSTNIALQVAGRVKDKNFKNKLDLDTNPRNNAEKIVQELVKDTDLMNVVDEVVIAGPGFVNFFIKTNLLLDTLSYIFSHKDTFGCSDFLGGKKIMFEYGDANTHKLPHTGHLFSYIYGESMVRILEMAGAKMFRACYQGDVGLHVAKCLWAFQKEKPQIPETLKEKVFLLSKLYEEGSKAHQESEEAKNEINQTNKDIYDRKPGLYDLYKETRQWSVDYYKSFESRLGIKYDRNYYESEVYTDGRKIVESNIGKVFKKSEGAVIFPGNEYDLHDRVFLTNYGTPTYEAKDMYLQVLKYKEWPFDRCIITTAHEQSEYFKVVFKALEILNPDFKGKLEHIGFGIIQDRSGQKLSSRKGAPAGIELIDLAVEKEATILTESKSFGEKEKSEVAETVGVGAIKYAFLKYSHLQDSKFDLEESLSLEGNSGPYLQYTYARAKSILGKADEEKRSAYDFSILKQKLNPEEILILRILIHFPEVVVEAAKRYSPNLICNYLFNLAQKFNNFYATHRMLEEKDEEVKSFRLNLTDATSLVLKNGLGLLGIKTTVRM